jgi:hypothetical protein
LRLPDLLRLQLILISILAEKYSGYLCLKKNYNLQKVFENFVGVWLQTSGHVSAKTYENNPSM